MVARPVVSRVDCVKLPAKEEMVALCGSSWKRNATVSDLWGLLQSFGPLHGVLWPHGTYVGNHCHKLY